MQRSAELGRAVLSYPPAALELWLSTTITVSLQQDTTQLQHLGPSALVDHLASEHVWVGRGNGMCAELAISVRCEPLAPLQLQELAASILKAPVWDQLGLCPSLPVNTDPHNGKLMLNIRHAHEWPQVDHRKRHRIGARVAPAAIRPPDGVPIVHLQSIQWNIDLVETKQPSKSGRAKRPKLTRCATSSSIPRPRRIELQCLGRRLVDSDLSDVLCHEEAAKTYPSVAMSVASSEIPSPAAVSRAGHERAQHLTMPSPHTCSSPSFSIDNSVLETVVDGALRLSVCNSLGRISNGLRVKANTFHTALGDIAPGLWKPGYLSVGMDPRPLCNELTLIQALSQRASLIPIISSSIARATSLYANSTPSSQGKAVGLATTQDDMLYDVHSQVTGRVGAKGSSSCITPQLWVNLQQNLSLKPTATILQAFYASTNEEDQRSDTEDLLASNNSSQLISATQHSQSNSIEDKSLRNMEQDFDEQQLRQESDVGCEDLLLNWTNERESFVGILSLDKHLLHRDAGVHSKCRAQIYHGLRTNPQQNDLLFSDDGAQASDAIEGSRIASDDILFEDT